MSQHAESILARSRGDEIPPLARSRGGWDSASCEIAWGWEPASREIARRWNPASHEIEPRPIVFPAHFSGKAALFSWRYFRDCSDSRWRIQRYYIRDYYTCARCSYGWNLESRKRTWTSGCLRIAATSKLWRNPDLFSRGVPLCSVASRVMITTDASTHGWGVVCEGMPASGL